MAKRLIKNISFSPHEMDIFEHISRQPNGSAYLKRLVIEDMIRKNEKPPELDEMSYYRRSEKSDEKSEDVDEENKEPETPEEPEVKEPETPEEPPIDDENLEIAQGLDL